MQGVFRGLALCFVAYSLTATAQNTFPNPGNVGIGTTSPSYPLTVSAGGTAGLNLALFAEPGLSTGDFLSIALGPKLSNYDCGALQFTYIGDGSTSNFVSLGNCAANQELNVLANGNVGIGTTTPSDLLDVSGNTAFGNAVEKLSLGSGSIGFNRRVVDGTIYNTAAYAYQFQHTESTTPASDYLALEVFNPGGVGLTGRALTINGNGQVGIGTALILPDGTSQTTAWTGVLCGGDYAEAVNVIGDRERYEPGDVLVIDPDAPGKFLKSAEPYSTAVTGIFATKPGVIGRRQTLDPSTASTEVPMAMVGIVPTKVSAENGPIKPGDLLVTASAIGYAMKGTDRSRLTGAVIAKALGTLSSGTGVIEAVVTLQ